MIHEVVGSGVDDGVGPQLVQALRHDFGPGQIKIGVAEKRNFEITRGYFLERVRQQAVASGDENAFHVPKIMPSERRWEGQMIAGIARRWICCGQLLPSS